MPDRMFDGTLTVRSAASTGLFVLAIFYTLHLGRVELLPIVITVLFTALLAPLLRKLKRIRIFEPVGAAILLSAVVFVLGSSVSRLAEPAGEWVARAPEAFREAECKLRVLKKPMQDMTKATELISKATNFEEAKKVQQVQVKSDVWSTKIFSVTGEFVAGLATTLILLYFLLSSGDHFLEKLVKVLPRLQDKKQAVEIVREIEGQLFLYLSTVTCINIGLASSWVSPCFYLACPIPCCGGRWPPFSHLSRILAMSSALPLCHSSRA